MAGICNLLCLTVIAVALNSVTADYCYMQSCEKDSHTMCKYPSNQTAAACGESYISGLTDADRNNIVNIHNELRQKVALGLETEGNPGPQPPAVNYNMPNLTWDNELETIAQRWVNQCNYGYDQCRNVYRFTVGQNIVMTSSSGNNTDTLQYLIQLWYNQVKMFNREGVNSYKFDSKTDQYTQMVWANTTTIGCGLISYKNSMDTRFLVCNYGPSGNWIGHKIYQTK